MSTAPIRPEDELFIPEDDDGWTLPGYFAAVPNVHPEVRFAYRPYTPPERAHFLAGIARASGDQQATRLLSMALAQRLKSWDLTYRGKGGERLPAPITAEFTARLRFQLWDKFMAVVIYQTVAGDTDPRWTREDKQLFDEAAFQALVGQQGSPQTNAVAALEGN